jgi:hypothetical protein
MNILMLLIIFKTKKKKIFFNPNYVNHMQIYHSIFILHFIKVNYNENINAKLLYSSSLYKSSHDDNFIYFI